MASLQQQKPLRRKYVNQAFVLADSFNKRFAPITLEVPRALVPLVDAPLINYTIEFLISSGIETIFVFCVAHADKIQEYLSTQHWGGNVNVKTIVSSSANTVGDALRRINDEGAIEADFVLCHADVVGHIPLADILHMHRWRKEQDPTVLMTTVYKRATPTHASRSLEDDTILGLTTENEILFWENAPQSSSIEVDPILITAAARGEMRMRYDLLDTNIDICSVEVLQLFQENFDYHSVRGEFISSVLADDITKHRLFAHVVYNEYAARVKDLRTYASVSRDVVHRWSAPVVPDNPLVTDDSPYRLGRGLVYRARNVKLHPRTKIGPSTVLGEWVKVGANTTISKSVVGRNCVIGDNCTIVNSFLWPGVVVENNCTVEWSLLCTNVRIYLGCTIGKGSVLSFDVHVGPNVIIKAHSRLTKEHVEVDGEEATKNIDLGNKGKGVLWVYKEEESTNALHVSGRRNYNLDGGADSDEEDGDGNQIISSGLSSVNTEEADEDDQDPETEEADAVCMTDFEVEVREIVLDGIQKNTPVENVVLEVNGRKFAHDKSFFDCTRSILYALLSSVPANVAPGKPLLTAFQKTLKQWKGLVLKFVQESDMVDILWTLQEYLERDFPRYTTIFQFLVHTFYDMDILDEDSIWAWEKEQRSLPEQDRKFLDQCAKFLEWLKNAEDED